MRTPLFWKDDNIFSAALRPASAIYGYVAGRRGRGVAPIRLSIPVICVGNVVAGGAGKTPTALAIGAMLNAQGIKAHFLSRGYGGSLKGPLQVEVGKHSASEVGDEALLLAQKLPTWVARDRVEGGIAAVQAGAEFIIMDDGYQNPFLQKDVNFLVIDGAYGVGNGRLMPAGPLREPLAAAIERASAIILYGEDKRGVLRHISPYKTVLHAALMPQAESALAIQGQSVVAFAGIARPAKFRRTLLDLGCEVLQMVEFPDHHRFKARELASLLAIAEQKRVRLVTTTKDYMRLPEAMRAEVSTLAVETQFQEPDAVWRVIFP
jgi:tetraacyldisaccharide 4'-kinase